MQKLNFTFSSFSVSRFYRNARSVKKLSLAGAKRSLVKATAAAGIAAMLSFSAGAQCNIFKDANPANPLRKLIAADANNTAVDFVDIDGDGDLDCYARVSYSTGINFYKNTGTAERPVYEASTTTGFEDVSLPRATHYMQFVDIDGDGDYDCFVSGYSYFYFGSARIKYFENQGTATEPHFVENEDKNPVPFAFSHLYVPFTFADIDGDGDMDFSYQQLYSTGFYGPQYTYLNTGTKKQAVYVYDNISNVSGVNTRTYYDWNKDGLMDYFDTEISRFDYNSAGSINYFRNVGSEGAPQYILDNAEAPLFPHNFPYRLVDLNNDGAPESFTAGAYYGTLSPVAVIGTSKTTVGGNSVILLSSKKQEPGYTYRWAFNGKTIPGATRPSLFAIKPGTYTLFVTDACGTGVSLPYTVSPGNLIAGDKITNSLANISSGVVVKAYPNPFVNAFTVQIPSAKAEKSTICITDLAGRVMLSQTTTAASIQIGGNLPKGIYLLQVWQGTEIVYRTTLVKQ